MIKPTLPTGQKHGRLTILAFERSPETPRHPKYRCQCDCGRVVFVQRANLERTHSCGCLRIQQLTARSRTHGQSKTKAFRIWAGIIDRCTNPNSLRFPNYGAKGITICHEWRTSFERFLADVGPMPTPKHTIDRIDNDKGYSPENCRWATMKTQRINQKRVVIHTVNGVSGTVKDLAIHFGVASYHTVHSRLYLLHWTLEKALLTAPGK